MFVFPNTKQRTLAHCRWEFLGEWKFYIRFDTFYCGFQENLTIETNSKVLIVRSLLVTPLSLHWLTRCFIRKWTEKESNSNNNRNKKVHWIHRGRQQASETFTIMLKIFKCSNLKRIKVTYFRWKIFNDCGKFQVICMPRPNLHLKSECRIEFVTSILVFTLFPHALYGYNVIANVLTSQFGVEIVLARKKVTTQFHTDAK